MILLRLLKFVLCCCFCGLIGLGKNVYLSMQILDVDTFPHLNRLYLDVSDIVHGQADFEINQVSMFVFNKLKPLTLSSK